MINTIHKGIYMIRILSFVLIQGMRRCQSASASRYDHGDSFFILIRQQTQKLKSRSLHWTWAHTSLDLVAHSMRYTVCNLIHHRCLNRFPYGGGPHTRSRSRSMNHTIAPNVRPLCLRRLANSQTAVINHTSGSLRAFWSGILRHTRILVFFLYSW